MKILNIKRIIKIQLGVNFPRQLTKIKKNKQMTLMNTKHGVFERLPYLAT